MARQRVSSGFYDPRRGDRPIRIERFEATPPKPLEPPRTNCFAIYRIETGSGQFWADASCFVFEPQSLLFFVPYQHIRIEPASRLQGEVIRFHANFLCVETFHAEAGCSGILFNDPYGVPVVPLPDDAVRAEIVGLISRIQAEQAKQDLAYSEVMLAHLKVLLILATRLKTTQSTACAVESAARHPLLAELRELIEQQYRAWHSPADYARQLHVTAKTLGRIVREQLGTTPTDLIRNRLLIHAKWELLHTLKPVKEVARELGFADELYFSRLFKKATGCSPTFFREYETEIRGGSNLSMFSGHAPILRAAATSNT